MAGELKQEVQPTPTPGSYKVRYREADGTWTPWYPVRVDGYKYPPPPKGKLR